MNSATNYDAKAILVARSVEEIAAPDDIFLFGSRARGDWDDASDIDIFTIADSEPATKERHRRALKAGQDRALEIYGHPVKIDLVRYSPADFERFRSARTHLTYHALKDGINMNCEPAAHSGRYPEVEPDNRPDVEQRFINYQRQILAAESLLEQGLGYEEVGQQFQRCLENAYKGFLAYLEYDDGAGNAWRRTHSLAALQVAIRTLPNGQRILGDADLAFLDEYTIDAPYEGVQEPLPDEYEVLESIRATVNAMMAFIATDSGQPLPTYTPPGPRR